VLALKPREVLLAELRDFGRNDDLAIGLAGVLLEIILVVVLARVELLQRHEFGHDRGVPDALGVKVGDRLLGGGLLLGAVVEDNRAVLRADVGALPVPGGRNRGS
jgi:hypothetical protein